MEVIVLVMGHRPGISKALNDLKIPHYIWSLKDLHFARFAKKIIIQPYPKTKEELLKHLPKKIEITHIIAGTEDSVYPSSLCRRWLGARSNSLSVAQKCTDKLEMKKFLHSKDIPMTEFIGKDMYEDPEQVIKELGSTIIVKPRKNSGGRGIKVIHSKEEIAESIHQKVLLEKAIEGSEGSIESFIEDGEIVFSNITHYKKIGLCNIIPAQYSKKLQQEILDLNFQVIKAMKLKWGMTHLEFYNTKEGLLFGEIALRPPGGYIMQTITECYNFDFWKYFVNIELGLELQSRPQLLKYGASIVIYPKVGFIKEIIGEKEASKLKSIVKFKLKAKVGDEVEKRTGVGDDFGYAVLAHQDKQQLLADVKAFDKVFKIVSSP